MTAHLKDHRWLSRVGNSLDGQDVAISCGYYNCTISYRPQKTFLLLLFFCLSFSFYLRKSLQGSFGLK